jgi:hypothetical protein
MRIGSSSVSLCFKEKFRPIPLRRKTAELIPLKSGQTAENFGRAAENFRSVSLRWGDE